MEDIARDQLGYLEDIAFAINKITLIPETSIIEEGTATETFDKLSESYGQQIAHLTDFTNNYVDEKLPGFIDTTTDIMTSTFSRGIEETLAQLQDLGINDLQTALVLLTGTADGLNDVFGEIGVTLNDWLDNTYERENRSTYERENRPTLEREEVISELRGTLDNMGGVLRTMSNDEDVNPLDGMAINTDVQLSNDQVNEVLTNSPQVQEDMTSVQNLMDNLIQNDVAQNQPVPVALTVNGQVSLDLNNMKYANLDVDKLGREIMNNSEVIAMISDKLTNSDNSYGLGLRVG